MSSSASPSTTPSAEYAENTFKSWPSLEKTTPEKSWTTWYKRVSASKKVHWDEIGIGQALALTIANSAKDEPLMAAATYFWSNTINAFLFNQGLMTPTLIDITMITGLDITSSANPMSMNTKNQFDFRTKSIGGWSGYVAAYMGQGSATPREHTWLNLMVMKVVNRPSVIEAEFPMQEPIVEDNGEERTHRRCMLYGEYASTPTDAGAKLSAELLKDWFCSFYEGFQKDARVLFPYEDSADLELPSDFRFGDINHEKYQKYREVLTTAISPCILPDPLWATLTILSWQDSRAETSTDGGTIDSSPPRQSNSRRDIEYAPGLIPNGGGPSSPVIGYHAPRTLTLLQDLIREPADAGKKRKTRSSAVDVLALAPKKKTKSKKTKTTDDLPALDPSIEQALDEEEIGEDVDQAAAEVSDTEKTPPASPKKTPPTPSAPTHFSRKKKTAVKKKPAATILKSAPPVRYF
uniref:Uncharacterized protein n=1 Tax=Oryza sativa subsp. japonica TaxID=39947 RepID=Q7XI00_ORYSJ|nr:hypothetical protein [Oryza sativa Japonica Group]BAC84402.1 hypothetical protein [Oryza sativa Japonica Group]